MEKTNTLNTNIARIICISDLKNGDYIKENNLTPNYVLFNNQKIFMVNIIGVVVSKELGTGNISYIIDDSTGSITIRSFESNEKLKNINIGDIVLIIAKPREYNNEKFLMPIIIKPLKNKQWLFFRKIQLKKNILKKLKTDNSEKKDVSINFIDNNNIEIKHTKQETNAQKNPYDIILKIIKNNDKGFGVSYEDIILNSGFDNCEDIIKSLIEEGEIFEIRPGILKVL